MAQKIGEIGGERKKNPSADPALVHRFSIITVNDVFSRNMGVYDLLDEQTWEYIIFFLAVFGMVLYSMAAGFTLVSQIGG